MYPYYFVAILGSDSEGDWAILNGRSGGPVSREACRSRHLRLSPAHPIYKATGKARQKKRRKESSSEKGRDCSRSSFGGSSIGARRAPVAEALNKVKYHVKEEKQ